MLASLGRLACRRRRLVALGWLALLLVGLAAGSGVFARLDPGAGLRNDTQSAVAARRLAAAGETSPDVLLLLDGGHVTDRATRARVTKFTGNLRSTPGVAAVSGGTPARSTSSVPPSAICASAS